MAVAVTGAAGLLGRAVLAALEGAGVPAFGIDLPGRGAARAADLCDVPAAMAALEGATALYHAAALPRPGAVPAAALLARNVGATWAVLEAAEARGIGTVVLASSFSVFGLPFAPAPVRLRRLPLDDTHPPCPQEAYGLSKWLSEETLDAWVRRSGGRAFSLRMPWLQSPETFAAEVGPRRAGPDAWRDLWAYLDLRDAGAAAVAAVAALRRPGAAGTHLRLLLSAADTYATAPTAALVAQGWPGVPYHDPGSVHAALIDTAAARAALGFVPRWSWRDHGLAGEGQA